MSIYGDSCLIAIVNFWLTFSPVARDLTEPYSPHSTSRSMYATFVTFLLYVWMQKT